MVIKTKEASNKEEGKFHRSLILQTNSIIQSRRGIAFSSPTPLRRGKPLTSELYPGDGIIPHPIIVTKKITIEEDIYTFLEKLYRSDPLVSAAVDHLVDYTLQSGFKIVWQEIPDLANKLQKWLRFHHFKQLMERNLRILYLMGTGYIWLDFRHRTGKRGRPRMIDPAFITGWKVLHPAHMYAKINEFGDIIGYVQRISRLDKQWAFFKPEEIIHMNYRPLADRVYGVGIVESILRDLHYERYSEHTLAEIFHDYLAPLLHVMCGMENAPGGGGQRPASPESLENVRGYLSTLTSNEDIITDNTVKINVVSPGSSIGDYDPALKHFKSNAEMGTRLPAWFFGESDRVTEASAVVMKEMVEKHVGSVQEGQSVIFETELFPFLLVDMVKEQIRIAHLKKFGNLPNESALQDMISAENIIDLPMMIWNPVESFQQKQLRYREELNSGGVTINEHRKEFGREAIDDPMADLPIPIIQLKLTLAQLQLTGQRQNQDSNQGHEDGKGERTPKKLKPNTDTVDGSGQPIKKEADLKSHKRGKNKEKKVK